MKKFFVLVSIGVFMLGLSDLKAQQEKEAKALKDKPEILKAKEAKEAKELKAKQDKEAKDLKAKQDKEAQDLKAQK